VTARENKSRHRSACARPTRSNSVAAVLRGRVVIRAPSSEGKEVILNIINEGEIFGEIALLNLDFVTRLERCGQTADAGDPFRNRWFVATRLPSFGAASELGRSILAAGQPSSFRPTDRGCEAAIQGDAAHRRIRRRDQGRAVGDESASRNWRFESTSLQRRVDKLSVPGHVGQPTTGRSPAASHANFLLHLAEP
jgi:hypothetical protein